MFQGMKTKILKLTSLLVAVAFYAASGCVTPQIPLPPPSVDDLIFTSVDPTKKTISISSTGDNLDRYMSARISVYNTATESGVIVRGAPLTGAFKTPPLPVEDGDQLEVRYTFRDELSDQICIVATFKAGQPRLCP